MQKKLCIGILAHVDAGKTTLSEALLYRAGKLRSLGRVDHKNTYLDTNRMERERGITIFSKQARFSFGQCDFILLDTPGHVDFSAETERTLSLLDYAILVISAPDGVQNHTRTLWQLLEYYHVPTFLFVNKIDISAKTKEDIEAELTKELCQNCVSFREDDSVTQDERLAMVDEMFLESFLAGTAIEDSSIAQMVSKRRLFPLFYGSALRLAGIDYFLQTLDRLTLCPLYDNTHFGAKIYKIARAGSNRLTFMKITSGNLRVRDEIKYATDRGEKLSEKVAQIRLYSGDKFEQVDTVSAGEICAVVGLSSTASGMGLGIESDIQKPVLEPVLSYCIKLPKECDKRLYFPKLKELEEEEPTLRLFWNEETDEIEAALMGQIQIDLFTSIIKERLGIDCAFGAGKILYKEKVSKKAIGIGHFEPLRHYAEVQLLLEPQPKGTGLIFDSRVPAHQLDINWQRLVLSNLYSKLHRGTAIGAPLTDTKITLVAGKAHLKHTEGGDFREATLRAVRHGAMRAGCILLEPYYKFRLSLPSLYVGRAMAELQTKSADFWLTESDSERTVIEGRGPAATLHDYIAEVIAFTKGQGNLTLISDGYEPCHNEEEIRSAFGYDPAADLDNPPHSVFCTGGAGFVVPWNEVEQHKHLNVDMHSADSEEILPKVTHLAKKYELSDEDLEAIMLKEFGPIKRRRYSEPKSVSVDKKPKVKKDPPKPQPHLLIIDGYNVIFAWESLSEIAKYSLEKARETLMDMLSNYVGYTKTELLLVFDAYLVKDGMGSDLVKDGYRVVYTKEDQTADAYIEKIMSEMGPNYHIRVVTADRLLQYSAVHSGISRMTPKEFEDEIISVGNEIRDFIQKLTKT